MPSTDRRLAAIMFTDIVGYTRMAQANEPLALELLEEHRGVVRSVLPSHGGTEIKTIGDAFLVEFRSALEAVLCAVEIQEKMGERNSKVPTGRRLDVRIGIHLGDVVHGSGDVYGDAVNVASRVEPLAEPGGVCISQQVYDNIRNKSELGIVKLGDVELKNVELPVAVYKVDKTGTGQAAPAGNAPRERLAVLPFVNISPDPNDEYFADGLTEELISRLSEIKGLKVIARTSVMNYKKKEKNVSQIGRELAVGSVIEGSVRKAGSRIRVSVQLVDSKTEEHLWASNYDKELDDIFGIQSDVASRVAESLSTGVFSHRGGQDTEDVEAYTAYLRAVQLLHEGSEESLKAASSLLEKATARVPNFSRAYAGLADVLCEMASGGYADFTTCTQQAEAAALKALETGPERAESHAALATVYSMLDRYQESASEAEKALQINPNMVDAYDSLGINYAALGRVDDALKAFQKAYALDPISRWAGTHAAYVLAMTGRPESAIGIFERLREAYPNHPRSYVGLAECYIISGDYSRAQEMLDRARAISPKDTMLLMIQGILYALTGRRAEAMVIVRESDTVSVRSARIFLRLFVETALGNLDEAFDVLMQAAELHSWPFLIGMNPLFSELRKDPRYAEFRMKVGLPP